MQLYKTKVSYYNVLMGVNRVSIKCDICDDRFDLRVTIGGNRQNHLFNCLKCDSFLEYGYGIRNLFSSDVGESFVNCSKYGDTASDRVINLHPAFPVPKNEIHNPRFFTNIYMVNLALENTENPMDVEGIVDADALVKYWTQVKINWELFDNDKIEILKDRIPTQEKGVDVDTQFFKYLLEFTSFAHLDECATPWNKRYLGLTETIISKNKPEVLRFLKFHDEVIFRNNMKLYKTAIQDFFSGFDDLKQVRLMAKLDLPTKGHVISFVNFESTKKVYGNLYEILDKTFNSLPLLEKITKNGNFDSFQLITLDGFLRSSIGNKLQSIDERNCEFTLPNSEITNNRIRNASHHNTIFYDKKSQEVTCVDKDKKLNINYLVYLTRCTHLMNYILGMMAVDLELYLLWKNRKS